MGRNLRNNENKKRCEIYSCLINIENQPHDLVKPIVRRKWHGKLCGKSKATHFSGRFDILKKLRPKTMLLTLIKL